VGHLSRYYNGYETGTAKLNVGDRFLRTRLCGTVMNMGNQTYMKRQKEMARQQKQKDKAARRVQRKAGKIKGGPPLETYNPLMPNDHPASDGLAEREASQLP
jgi:hypothetical protein